MEKIPLGTEVVAIHLKDYGRTECYGGLGIVNCLQTNTLTVLIDGRLRAAEDCGCHRCNDLLAKVQVTARRIDREKRCEHMVMAMYFDKNTIVCEKAEQTEFSVFEGKDKLAPLVDKGDFIESLIEAENHWQLRPDHECVGQRENWLGILEKFRTFEAV